MRLPISRSAISLPKLLLRLALILLFGLVLMQWVDYSWSNPQSSLSQTNVADHHTVFEKP
ncbi:MAG: hypothetical protein AB8H47_05295 [Bacteroidia bacterium]